ncbi:MAG: hypothetical protein RIS41_106 [Actinomycetota bacterium]
MIRIDRSELTGGDGESICKRDSVVLEEPVTIHLCGPPEECSGCPERASHSSPLLDLASSGVCRAEQVAPFAGALLPHRFTLACAGFPAIGGLFLLHCP